MGGGRKEERKPTNFEPEVGERVFALYYTRAKSISKENIINREKISRK